jgi:hypothetical protein
MAKCNPSKLICIMAFVCLTPHVYAQEDTLYTNGRSRAINLYHAGQYRQSAEAFSHTFAAYGGGYNDDRYTAACSWTLAGNKDSAFYQLNHIATKGNFDNTDRLLTDDDLESLHTDARWNKMFAKVKQNKEKTQNPKNKKK